MIGASFRVQHLEVHRLFALTAGCDELLAWLRPFESPRR
jgi:hypothetical protein